MPDINDNDRHIDELLQSLGEGWRYWPKKHAALERIVAERDSLRAELAAAKAELVSKTDELAAMRQQRDEAVRALKEIAHQDYRGHPSTESQIAMHALAAMRKGEADAK